MSTEGEGPEVRTVAYFLVLLVPGENHAAAPHYFAAHVDFIDTMIGAKVVLLGGDFASTIDGAEGAYLLHTASAADAAAWASRDPFVANGIYRPRIVAWNLVGISTAAIDPAFSGE